MSIDNNILIENEECKKALLSSIFNEETILFVGTGLSKRFGCPSWEELINKLIELAKDIDNQFGDLKNNNIDPLSKVDIIKDFIESKHELERYYQLLKSLFKINGNDNFIEFLISIPFLGFITTNYDYTLNNQLSQSFILNDTNRPEIKDFFTSLRKLTKNKITCHIHGRIDQVENIILGGKDYKKYYGNLEECDFNKIHNKFLWAILAIYKVVFIGFSLEDPFIKLSLRNVCKDLWQFHQPSHFIILDITDSNKAIRIQQKKIFSRDYGLTTVFYDNSDGEHKNLENIFQIFQEHDIIPIDNDTIISDTFENNNIELTIDDINNKMLARIKNNED